MEQFLHYAEIMSSSSETKSDTTVDWCEKLAYKSQFLG